MLGSAGFWEKTNVLFFDFWSFKLVLHSSQVKWVEQQRILERSKRDVIPGEDELVERAVARLRRDTAVTIRDPFYKDQWYLVRTEYFKHKFSQMSKCIELESKDSVLTGEVAHDSLTKDLS